MKKKNIEIIPPKEIKPDVDIQEVAERLASPDYDERVRQMVEIIKVSNDEELLGAYIAPEIFTALIDTVKIDTSKLAKPTEEQNAARDKVKEYIIAADKAIAEGKEPEPYNISDEETQLAIDLSEKEMAERNKSYALALTAILAKAYADGVEKQTGNIVPLTDLPGTSAMVDVLRYEKNPDTKLAAVDSLKYISKPEYKEDIITILTLATQDKNIKVAQYAALTAMSLMDAPRTTTAEHQAA